MPRQLELPTALKDWGLADYLIEVNGWQWRGRSEFNPGGGVNHHTAGSIRNSIPSLNILINGRAGLAGPLCNIGQSRSSNFDSSADFDKIYLIAAGRANHAGRGSWKGLVGNSSVFGLEIEHVGDLNREGFSERRAHTAYRVHAAMAEVGGYGTDKICQHFEWTSRKIDFIGANGANFRTAVALTRLAKSGLEISITEEEDMIPEMVRAYYKLARGKGHEVANSEPAAYLHWIGSSSRKDDPVSFLNEHLVPTLEKESGKKLPRY